jgi:hypothetical protein
MEYGQFIKILEGENLNRKETVEQLKEIIRQYPYFQTAHVLLAKALHEQNNIDYDRSLKLAAVYAGDRSVLFDYINRKEIKETADEIPESVSQIQADETFKEIPDVKAAEAPISIPSFIKEEEPYKEYFSEEEILGIEEEEEERKEKIYDPQELLRKRLSEILQKKEPTEEIKPEPTASNPIDEIPSVELTPITLEETTEKIQPEPIVTKTETTPKGIESPKEQIISREAEKAKDDPLSRMEVEYAMEESILESLEKLPPLPQKPKESIPEIKSLPQVEKEPTKETTVEDESSPRSFTEWLRAKSSGPYHNYTEVHSTSEIKKTETVELVFPEKDFEETSSTEEELIDKFITTEPKIIPSKTEFYSPINQAKKSLMEHDDVVSETLAKIYRDQGNLAKARWSYERLMLLHPEKSSFFAALLKEIDDLNKEDL